jgi:hypothetical protein
MADIDVAIGGRVAEELGELEFLQADHYIVLNGVFS